MLLKGQEHRGHLSPSELADALLQERATIARYMEQVRELVDDIGKLERRYEMTSSEMIENLASGDLDETGEIVDWLMMYERYRRVSAGWPTLESAALD